MLALQENEPTVIEPDNLKISAFEYETGIGQFDLTFNVMATEKVTGGLQVNITYNTALFQPNTVKRIGQHFEILLSDVLAEANKPIKALNILTLAEKQQLLLEFNHTEQDYPPEKTIIDLF
jgi:non-ribosomal peptide synthetase component F